MKVFVAGATGALGRALVPQLMARGHEVVGMTRTGSKQGELRALGARPVVADALEPDAVAQAVASAEPEVIFPEPRSEILAESWRSGAAKALERQNAAVVAEDPSSHEQREEVRH
jgi:nucleoside-diphosphate-sugar epimerase